jgi:hypothetical protein
MLANQGFFLPNHAMSCGTTAGGTDLRLSFEPDHCPKKSRLVQFAFPRNAPSGFLNFVWL